MRFWIVLAVALYGACHYVTRRYEFHDALAYAKKHPENRWSPAVDYYAGMVYYQRSDYPKAQEAFSQLLTDYPTSHYLVKGLIRLGDSAEENHDWPLAKQAYGFYIEQYPDGKDIEIARKKLELLNYHHP